MIIDLPVRPGLRIVVTSRPVDFRRGMDSLSTLVKETLATAKAIKYTLNHWNGLTVFLTDGRVEIDSNIVERTIRPIALGRRNALFAGSTRGAEAWAILASIINTAKLHELDPQTYLVDVFEKIVSGQTKVNSLHELLPWAWKEARTQQTAAAT